MCACVSNVHEHNIAFEQTKFMASQTHIPAAVQLSSQNRHVSSVQKYFLKLINNFVMLTPQRTGTKQYTGHGNAPAAPTQ